MSTSTWKTHVYLDDHVLPLPGEVIKIRYVMSTANDFNYGPRSEGTFGPPAGTPSSAARRLKRPPFHHVIVSAVSPSADNSSFVIGFFPIVSYSAPPFGFTGAVWDPVAWMEVQPEDSLLRHLPVPAVGWDPAPPALWGPDHLDFGGWRNSCPSWATTLQRTIAIPGTEAWRRLSPTVTLSSRHLATLKVFESNAVVHLLAQHSSITANRSEIPEYTGVWEDIFSSEDDGDTVSDVDPVSFWRYPGAPQGMMDMVRRADEEVRRTWEAGIKSWLGGIARE